MSEAPFCCFEGCEDPADNGPTIHALAKVEHETVVVDLRPCAEHRYLIAWPMVLASYPVAP